MIVVAALVVVPISVVVVISAVMGAVLLIKDLVVVGGLVIYMVIWVGWLVSRGRFRESSPVTTGDRVHRWTAHTSSLPPSLTPVISASWVVLPGSSFSEGDAPWEPTPLACSNCMRVSSASMIVSVKLQKCIQ